MGRNPPDPPCERCAPGPTRRGPRAIRVAAGILLLVATSCGQGPLALHPRAVMRKTSPNGQWLATLYYWKVPALGDLGPNRGSVTVRLVGPPEGIEATIWEGAYLIPSRIDWRTNDSVIVSLKPVAETRQQLAGSRVYPHYGITARFRLHSLSYPDHDPEFDPPPPPRPQHRRRRAG